MDVYSAVGIGDETEVARLLKQDPNAANARGPNGYPALHKAIEMNYQNIVELLLAADGDVEIRDSINDDFFEGATPLHCAAFWGRYEIAKLLI